ncbi:hamartin-like isoform X5 [Dreissena polymorpha]|uniref:hamartin-like isoform X5 n=1 Tax=Dreissena polymorpha TaxID=45954 RepID=UPI002265192D|nr:hamartin-like isoform X5 [Dreissena polymorpha]
MAASMLEGKQIDVKELFTLLESEETQVTEGITTLIQEHLASTKESWLVHSLVDYYFLTQSQSVVDILCKVADPHDKHLLEKLHDGIKSSDHQLPALQLLLFVVCREPLWLHKIVSQSVLKVILKCLKAETSIPVLMTGVTIVTILLPSIPTLVGPYLPDLFEVFNRLASFSVKKLPSNAPDIFLLHLQIAVYSLFHRLYGMFPYNFLTYLRHYYSKKENVAVFDEVIKSMLERVRLHPHLITGTKEQETSTQRWKKKECHDIIVECNKMSLDPIEGTWEELQCPVLTNPSHFFVRPLPDSTDTVQAITALTGPELSPGLSPPNTFWSPSEVIGLSTPPCSQLTTPAPAVTMETTVVQSTSQQVGPSLLVNAVLTPVNTPVETPPVSEDVERVRTNSRGIPQTKSLDPKRLSCEFSTNHAVPLLTPSSHIPSVPPSPLRTEFINTPPLGAKTFPVLHAARELQFDHELSEEMTKQHLAKIKESRVETLKPILDAKALGSDSKAQNSGPNTAESSKATSRCSSLTFLEDSLRSGSQVTYSVNQSQEVDTGSQPLPNQSSQEDGAAMKHHEDVAVVLDPGSSQLDTVSIDNLSQVIEGLSISDEENDDEVSELTSNSQGTHPTLTAESVKKFMKSVNRIRFNSLTATNTVEPAKPKFSSKSRSRSCPQFPKVTTTYEDDEDEEEDVVRSLSTDARGGETQPCKFEVSDMGPSVIKPIILDSFAKQPADLKEISLISGTSTTVCVNVRQETTVTMTTTKFGDMGVGVVPQCPVFADRAQGSSHPRTAEERSMLQVLRDVLNISASNTCAKCKGNVTENPQDHAEPFFLTYSPPELLDRHLQLGHDIHAKELSRIPMPSTQDVNWTHFGGMPPADEISILRTQLKLMHNQLMYERHRRDQHAKRNRRLLRHIANSKTLEEQNNSMREQLQERDLRIRDLQVSIKLLERENRKLNNEQESHRYQKLVQLSACLQENEDLKNAKKEFNTLLVRQREEQDALQKNLNACQAKLFNATKELEKMSEVAADNVKLKEQVIHLQKEVVLMGELQHKSSEKLLAAKASKASRLEHQYAQKTLVNEINGLNYELKRVVTEQESCRAQLREQAETLAIKERALAEVKMILEKMKTSHKEEMKSMEEKHRAALRVNQALEAHSLQLYAEIERVKAKLNSGKGGQARSDLSQGRVKTKLNSDGSKPQTPTCLSEPFRERIGSDPSSKSASSHRNILTRMTSVPAVSNVIGEDLEGQRSNSVPKGNEAKHSAVDKDYHIVGEFEHSADMGAVQQSRNDETEGASVTSRVSNRGQQHQFTDREDSHTAFYPGNNTSYSGFH